MADDPEHKTTPWAHRRERAEMTMAEADAFRAAIAAYQAKLRNDARRLRASVDGENGQSAQHARSIAAALELAADQGERIEPAAAEDGLCGRGA